MPNKSDTQLLCEYATRGSEPAFGEIVARHTDLVYSAALRQSGIPEAAREIAQSVFIDLARKARTLAKELDENASLAGWLYRGTRYAVLNFFAERSAQKQDKPRTPEEATAAFDTKLKANGLVFQFGGDASTGLGYCTVRLDAPCSDAQT